MNILRRYNFDTCHTALEDQTRNMHFLYLMYPPLIMPDMYDVIRHADLAVEAAARNAVRPAAAGPVARHRGERIGALRLAGKRAPRVSAVAIPSWVVSRPATLALPRRIARSKASGMLPDYRQQLDGPSQASACARALVRYAGARRRGPPRRKARARRAPRAAAAAARPRAAPPPPRPGCVATRAARRRRRRARRRRRMRRRMRRRRGRRRRATRAATRRRSHRTSRQARCERENVCPRFLQILSGQETIRAVDIKYGNHASTQRAQTF
jgi:hypothetical protein